MQKLIRVVGVLLLVHFLLPLVSLSQPLVWQKRFDGQGISIGINPLNGNTLFVQGNDNRLNISRDGGNSWTATSTFLPFETREFIIHPNDTNTVLVVNFSDGLYRSTDGGANFSLVLNGYGIDGESVVYDPVHPDTLYAGNFADASVYRSTNRGQTWTFLSHAGTTGNLCTVAIRPDSVNILYAGTGFGSISKSTDAGLTWKQVKGGGSAEIPKIVVDPSQPLVAYAAAYAGDPNATGVWKTTDGGEHWALTSLHNISVWSMEIDRAHPDTIYTGTFSEYGSAVYRTTDAGATWAVVGRGFSPYNSLWNLKVDHQDGSHVYVAGTHGDFNPDGVYRLLPATGGADGFVINGLTSSIITFGTVSVAPTGEAYDLASMNGFYRTYRTGSDTTTSRVFSVSINSTLFALDTIALVNGSILSHNIVVQPGSIAGTVYNDLNKNGVRDFGEPGLSGWTVKLTGSANASTLSDGSGDFLFNNLFPGTYTVQEQPTFGWAQSGPAGGTYSVTINLANRVVTGKDFGNRTVHRVTAVAPAAWSDTLATGGAITVAFDTAADPATFIDTATFVVRGQQTGLHRGAFNFTPAHDAFTFTPFQPFLPGEKVVADVSSKVRTMAADLIAAYVWEFNVKAQHAGGAFLPRVDFTVGSAPWAVAAADLNHDGKIDIVAANANSNNVSVLLNNGDGTFAPKVDYPTGTAPRALALGDVDNDGDIDIVTANSGFSTATVLRNNGSGAFPTRNDYGVGGSSSSVTLTDLKGNGLLDIVSTISTNNNVTVLADTGSGYGGTGNFPAGTFPWWAVAGDVNNDGGTDIVLVNSVASSSAGILQNTGSGTLGSPIPYSLASFARGITLTDLDGDGRPDILATNSSSDNFSFLLQNVAGSYPSRTDVPTAHVPWAIATGDLNGDGLADVCVVNSTSNILSVYLNTDGTHFTRSDLPTGAQPRGLAIADLNGDGNLDIVVANGNGTTVSVYFNALALPIAAGWNMLSVPALVPDFATTAIYPAASSHAFVYNGGYQTKDTLANGTGFWIKFDSSGSALYPGTLVTGGSVPLVDGWNLVGGTGSSVPVGAVSTVPGGLIASSFFSYSGAYQIASTIDPGQAYWVRSNGSGTLLIPGPVASGAIARAESQSGNTAASRLELVDRLGRRQILWFSASPGVAASFSAANVLPPLPPEGAFDARFTGDRLFASGEEREARILVHGAEFPVAVRWTLVSGEKAGWTLNAGSATHALETNGAVRIAGADELSALALSFGGPQDASVPKLFALHQNYPNPFNPSTTIAYDLPRRSVVRVTVTDLLGREVARVADGEQEAGSYTVQFSPQLSSGVYFYRISARSLEGDGTTYEQTRKMALLR